MSGLSTVAWTASPSAAEQDVTEVKRRDCPSESQFSSSNLSLDGVVSELDPIDLALSPYHPRVRGRSEIASACKDNSAPITLDLSVPSVPAEDGPKRRAERLLPATMDSFDQAVMREDIPRDDHEYPPSSRGIQGPVEVASLSTTQKAYHNKRTWVYFSTTVWCLFLLGWNDGSTGPLLPRIQKYYDVGFITVSLLFVLNCVGYVSGGLINVWLNDRWGFGKIVLMGACSQTLSYIVMSPGGPFPVMLLGYCLSGFGMALQNAQTNGLVSSFRDAPTKLGLLHAGYGLGAFAAPFVATQFSKSTNNWHLYYIVSAGLSLSNAVCLYYVFRFKRQEGLLNDAGQPEGELNTTRDNIFKQVFRLPALHILAIFAVIYVGIEVTLGGWIVTFIEDARGAGANGGYISSGFFGGLMIGRVGLIWLNQKVGPRRILFIYLTLAIQLEVTIWLVPSLVGNAVAVAFIGCLLGPMFPIMLNHSTQILPKWLVTPSVGWIAGAGQAGSAILPFLTGLLSSKFGITSLQPFVISMMSVLLVIWAIVPRTQTRID